MNDIDFFYLIFDKELDSWFSSDIACCDYCYKDFLEEWPFAYEADNADFQCSSISLDCFYEGSRIPDFFTKNQFDKYIKEVGCPRCGNSLKHNIWAYNLPFDIDLDFEKHIFEIDSISKQTPFLLLKSPFANKVLEAITTLSIETKAKKITDSLYRARNLEQVKNILPAEFDFTPKRFVTEGRYNHAGIPALYLGSSLETCFYELRKIPCLIAEIKIIKPIKILDLTNTYESHFKYSDLLDTLVYSALISAKQDDTGWFKPKYVFSRFIADCAKSAGFDAIKYPSTRIVNGNYNLVILNNSLSIDKGSEIKNIIKYDGKSTEIL